MRKILVTTILLGAAFFTTSRAIAAETSKPVLLYSRYYNAVGENRYEPAGSYSNFLARLSKDFVVRVSSQPLNHLTLSGADVVLIANPSDKAAGTNPPPPHVTADDLKAITTYVANGGGLIIMGNQENHNLETKDVNQLLSFFGLQFANVYTDAKKLVIPKETPIIGGLRWGYYTGNQVQIKERHAGKPRALVLNDTDQKPITGERNPPGVLMAIAEPARGRVVAVTDSGWLSNDALSDKGIGPAIIKDQDNYEIFRKLASWAAEHRPDRNAAQ